MVLKIIYVIMIIYPHRIMDRIWFVFIQFVVSVYFADYLGIFFITQMTCRIFKRIAFRIPSI